jgi:COMPASS component SWD1
MSLRSFSTSSLLVDYPDCLDGRLPTLSESVNFHRFSFPKISFPSALSQPVLSVKTNAVAHLASASSTAFSVLSISFNRLGSLLACGTVDGSLLIYDFECRQLCLALSGVHSGRILTVQWCKNGQSIMSAGSDGIISLVDLRSFKRNFALATSSLVRNLMISTSDTALLSFYDREPLIFHIPHAEKLGVSSLECAVPIDQIPCFTLSLSDFQEKDKENDGSRRENLLSAAIFTQDSKQILGGSNRGIISLYLTPSFTSSTIPSSSALSALRLFAVGRSGILGLSWSRDGAFLLINSNDRYIRLFSANQFICNDEDSSSPILIHSMGEFHDAVNRVQWRKCCLSSNGEYVIGFTGEKSSYRVYIWNRDGGQLTKMLEGSGEGVLDAQFHPDRNLFTVANTGGIVQVWLKSYSDSWSAFAPDFVELADNEEYCEREDEFDSNAGRTSGRNISDDQEIPIDLESPDELAHSIVKDELTHLSATILPDLELQKIFKAKIKQKELQTQPSSQGQAATENQQESGKRNREELSEGEASQEKKVKSDQLSSQQLPLNVSSSEIRIPSPDAK